MIPASRRSPFSGLTSLRGLVKNEVIAELLQEHVQLKKANEAP